MPAKTFTRWSYAAAFLVAALISTNEPENLRRAFYLDSTRQVEIIEKLIPLEQDDMIAGLSSDNHRARLYQAYY